jgi:hypothetical protein
MPDDALGVSHADLQTASVEGRSSWIAASVTLAVLSIAYGSTFC